MPFAHLHGGWAFVLDKGIEKVLKSRGFQDF